MERFINTIFLIKSMIETQYGIIKAKQPEFPVRSLLRVPHKDGNLEVAYPAFGPNTYSNNLTEMQKSYSHPVTGERISFREPTTDESISASVYDFKDMAKPQIFDPRWLQAGRIVRTLEGVFANTKETDESALKSLLKKCTKFNGIYLGENGFGFAPYETFKQGVQESEEFAEGGLARLLEHSEGKAAENLRAISSPKFYRRGVNVINFDKVKEPVSRVVGLLSDRGLDNGGLDVGGGWDDDSGGYAFGVLNPGEASAQKISCIY